MLHQKTNAMPDTTLRKETEAWPVPTSTPSRYAIRCKSLNAPPLAATLQAKLSPEVVDLLNHILVPSEADRLTIPQIVEHPWSGADCNAHL